MRREGLGALLGLVRLVNAAVIVVAGVSLGVFLRGEAIFGGAGRAAVAAFFLLPITFSLAWVWLVSEVVGVYRPRMGRADGLLLGLGLHFSVGLAGWVLFPDVPCGSQDAGEGFLFWVPLWIFGLLSKVGVLDFCSG